MLIWWAKLQGRVVFDEVIVQEESRSDVDCGERDWFRFRDPSWWVEKLPQIGLADLWVG